MAVAVDAAQLKVVLGGALCAELLAALQDLGDLGAARLHVGRVIQLAQRVAQLLARGVAAVEGRPVGH